MLALQQVCFALECLLLCKAAGLCVAWDACLCLLFAKLLLSLRLHCSVCMGSACSGGMGNFFNHH